MNEQITYNYLEDYLNEVRSRGRHTFTLQEAKKNFPVSEKALTQSIFRLKSKGKIAQIRQGFYAIISPEYTNQGMLPIHLFIDDLMKFLDRKYYVGLFSAAALHGAAHQQPMEYFVITESPALRPIKTKKLKLNFFLKKEWSDKDISTKKTDAGYLPLSSPELTALDLLVYAEKMGMNRKATVISELAEEMSLNKLSETAQRCSKTSALQKLGYLFDKVLDEQDLALILMEELSKRRMSTIPLVASKEVQGSIDDTWKIIVNSKIEVDL